MSDTLLARRAKENKEENDTNILCKNNPVRGSDKCKHPEVEGCLVSSSQW